jgi:hypothetical protein
MSVAMTTFEAITPALAKLPPDQVARVGTWLDTRDEAAGKLEALAGRALAEHRAGRTEPL